MRGVDDSPSLASRTLADTRRGKERLGPGKMEDIREMAEGGYARGYEGDIET